VLVKVTVLVIWHSFCIKDGRKYARNTIKQSNNRLIKSVNDALVSLD
jgi:hypothetical protein